MQYDLLFKQRSEVILQNQAECLESFKQVVLLLLLHHSPKVKVSFSITCYSIIQFRSIRQWLEGGCDCFLSSSQMYFKERFILCKVNPGFWQGIMCKTTREQSSSVHNIYIIISLAISRCNNRQEARKSESLSAIVFTKLPPALVLSLRTVLLKFEPKYQMMFFEKSHQDLELVVPFAFRQTVQSFFFVFIECDLAASHTFFILFITFIHTSVTFLFYFPTHDYLSS